MLKFKIGDKLKIKSAEGIVGRWDTKLKKGQVVTVIEVDNKCTFGLNYKVKNLKGQDDYFGEEELELETKKPVNFLLVDEDEDSCAVYESETIKEVKEKVKELLEEEDSDEDRFIVYEVKSVKEVKIKKNITIK